MSKLNLDFYNGENGYSDGGVETELIELINSGEDLEEAAKKDGRWPVYYHLSPKRENILNWYPFKKNCSVLEIGSGPGALTGLLAKRAGTVVSVELTKPRADVNAARSSAYDNVEIMVGNFNNMVFKQKFDYVILNGVLEYAGSFTDGAHPYRDFLEKIRPLLKKNGTLLIAIENRFGLKYFNGTPEDHTARLFDGIDGYAGIDFVRTFTKTELTDLLKESGFKKLKFFYPAPDYKLPEAIYTDASVDMAGQRISTDSFNLNRLCLFNEGEVFRTLLKENIADRFFNSFLVAASLDKNYEDGVVYSKISDHRRKKFQISTTIREKNGDKKVLKRALYPEGQAHLKQMQAYAQAVPVVGDYVTLPCREKDGALEFDFVSGQTLEQKLLEMLKKGDKKAFETAIRRFAGQLLEGKPTATDYCGERFAEVFGPKTLREPFHVGANNNIDLIFSNIIVGDKNYVLDYEWVFDFGIPAEYIVFRSLYYLYHMNVLVQKQYTLEKLMKLAGIPEKFAETFIAWDEHFGNRYVAESSARFSPMRTLGTRPELTKMLENCQNETSLYLDFGDGFDEKNRVKQKMKIDGDTFSVTFNLQPFLNKNDGRLRCIRWDPLETACELSDITLQANGGDLDVYDFSENAPDKARTVKWLYLLSSDPQLLILGDYQGVSEITLSGKIKSCDIEDVIALGETLKAQDISQRRTIDELTAALASEKQRVAALEAAVSALQDQVNIAQSGYDSVTHSRLWRSTQGLRDILDLIK